MKTKQYTVNDRGLAEISGFLLENHKRRIPESCLSIWANYAEAGINYGACPVIEIRAIDSVSGHAETFTVSESGFDSEEIEID